MNLYDRVDRIINDYDNRHTPEILFDIYLEFNALSPLDIWVLEEDF